ncbi:hypothetical protein ACQ86K_12930 [Mucilaginibacter sp. P19]|uniref:TerB family tellurite resistance protein n=1 Tax=Mucilaginibacter gossypii TaxID=551996 RepID=A0A1G8D751_9SPHI|nr:hypothetical protein [Mucilaginibacter gossypii]SDH53373.1 hypothetical protein SAMN05192573_110139 [Mucilaginibacter gossypii]
MASINRKILSGWLICFSFCAFSFHDANAQTFAEWFQQKKTQIKYLTEQIAALEQYSSYVKQGYRIAQSGWGGVSNWLKGEFNLHSTYYNSLRTVNLVIKNDPKADSIITYAQRIPLQFDLMDSLSAIDDDTRNYIGKVKAAVLLETDKDLSELQLVMTDGKLEMSDDERIERLDGIYQRVRDKLGFSMAFCNGARMLIIQRNNSLNDLNTLRRLYEIN